MKLDADKQFEMTRSDSLVGERQFQFTANAKAFRVLIDRLYSNKEGAVVREVCTNAFDSHVMAGCGQKRFTISMPSDLDPNFRVIDNGVGLDEEPLYHLMAGVFNSAKEESDETAGAYGLGSKCPFAITDTFTIISRFAGVKRHFMCFKNEKGVPSVLKTSEEPLEPGEHPTGVEVVIPVAPSRFQRFHEEVRRQLFFFSPRPEIAGFTEKEVDELFGSSGTQEKLSDRLYTMRNHGYPGSPAVIVQVGPVGYPVSWDSFLGKDPVMDEQVNFLRKVVESNRGTTFVFQMKIGEVDVPPSRETIEFSERTISNMRKVTEGLREKIVAQYLSRIKQCKTPMETVAEDNRLREELGDDLYTAVGIEAAFSEHIPLGMHKYLGRNYQGQRTFGLDGPKFNMIAIHDYKKRFGELEFKNMVMSRANVINMSSSNGSRVHVDGQPPMILDEHGNPTKHNDDIKVEWAKMVAEASAHDAALRKNLAGNYDLTLKVGDSEYFIAFGGKVPLVTNDRWGEAFQFVKWRSYTGRMPVQHSEEIGRVQNQSTAYNVKIHNYDVVSMRTGSTVYILVDRRDEVNLRLMGAFNDLLKPNSDGNYVSSLRVELITVDPLLLAQAPQEINKAVSEFKQLFQDFTGFPMHANQFRWLSSFPKGKNPKAEKKVNEPFKEGPATGVTTNNNSITWEKLNLQHYAGCILYERGDDRIEKLRTAVANNGIVRISPTAARKGTREYLINNCGLIDIKDITIRLWREGVSQADMRSMLLNTQFGDSSNSMHDLEDFQCSALRGRKIDMGDPLLNRFYSHYMPNREVKNQQLYGTPRIKAEDYRVIQAALKPPVGTKLYRQLAAIKRAIDAYKDFTSDRALAIYLAARAEVNNQNVYGEGRTFNEDFKVFTDHYNLSFQQPSTPVPEKED